VRGSIVVPVYNEQATVAAALERIRAAIVSKPIEIIVVDDGSTDGTSALLRELEPRIDKLVVHPRNMGKGAAVRSGLGAASGEAVGILDADLEYDPTDLVAMFETIWAQGADAVLGFRSQDSMGSQRPLQRLANLAISAAFRAIYSAEVKDVECCLKAFRADLVAASELTEPDFRIEIELAALLCRRAGRLAQVPVRYSPRSKREGKKIRPKDAALAFRAILAHR
jgi:glycosyltransferase involved in cell wall biosynthesis